MGCFVVAGFVVTNASCSFSAIAELLVHDVATSWPLLMRAFTWRLCNSSVV